MVKYSIMEEERVRFGEAGWRRRGRLSLEEERRVTSGGGLEG